MLKFDFLKRLKRPSSDQPQALIADDAEIMRMLVVRTLKDAGFAVAEAENGEQALKLAKKGHYDLVITDIRMPKMDGLQLIQKLRNLSKYRSTPILSLTNLNTDSFKQKLRMAGASGWVQKPFGRDSLIRTINKLLA